MVTYPFETKVNVLGIYIFSDKTGKEIANVYGFDPSRMSHWSRDEGLLKEVSKRSGKNIEELYEIMQTRIGYGEERVRISRETKIQALTDYLIEGMSCKGIKKKYGISMNVGAWLKDKGLLKDIYKRSGVNVEGLKKIVKKRGGKISRETKIQALTDYLIEDDNRTEICSKYGLSGEANTMSGWLRDESLLKEVSERNGESVEGLKRIRDSKRGGGINWKTKVQALSDYLIKGENRKELSRKYGFDTSLMSRLSSNEKLLQEVAKDSGKTVEELYKIRERRNIGRGIEKDVKIQVLNDYLIKDVSRKQLSEKDGFAPTQISQWLRNDELLRSLSENTGINLEKLKKISEKKSGFISKENKIRALIDYLIKGMKGEEIHDEYGFSPSYVSVWSKNDDLLKEVSERSGVSIEKLKRIKECKRVISKDTKIQALSEYLTNNISKKKIADKYGFCSTYMCFWSKDEDLLQEVSERTGKSIEELHRIREWKAGIPRDVKIQALSKYFVGGLSQKEIAKEYGFDESQLSGWPERYPELLRQVIQSHFSEIFTKEELLKRGLNEGRISKLIKHALKAGIVYDLGNENYTTQEELFEVYKSLQIEKKKTGTTKKRGRPPLQKNLRVFPLEADGKLVRVERRGYVSGKPGEGEVKVHRDAEINEVSKRIIKILNAANIVPSNAFEYETELAKRFSSQEDYIRVYEEGIFPLTTNLMRVVLENESGGNILDIGNGVGAPTLQALVQLGRKFEYLGVDCVDGIQEFNRKKHGDVFVTLKVPYEFGEIEGKFNLITASLVLDSLNLPEICTTMIGSHQLLEKDGEIITILSKAREERAQQVLSVLKGIGYKVDINPENYYFNLKLKDLGSKTVNNYFYIIRAHKDSDLSGLDLSKKYEFYLKLSLLKARKFEKLKDISTSSEHYLKEIINELLRIEKHDYKEPPFRFFEEFKEKERQKSEMIEKAKEEAKKDVRHPSAVYIYEDFAAHFAGDDFLNIKMLERSLAFVRGKLKGPDKSFQKTFHESSEKAMSVIRGRSRYKKRNRFREDLSRYLETLQKNLDFSMLDV